MRPLNLRARIYLLLLLTVTAIAGGAVLPYSAILLEQPLLTVVGLVGLVLSYYAEVSFEIQPGHRVSMTVDEAVAIFFIATLGPAGGWLMAASTAVFGLWRRAHWQPVLFNTAMLFISYMLAALTYHLVQPVEAIPFGGATGLLTFLSVATIYYVMNALLFGLMVALATSQPVFRVYRENMQQVNWVQLLTFTIGASMAALWAIDRWLVIYGVLTLLIAQRAFATVIALQAETQRRQQLAEERARLSEEIQRQEAELARAAKLSALGTFAAGIAHEFNNMLTAILGHAQLGQLSEAPADKDHSLDVIARVCQRASSITSSLLTFARRREPELSPGRLQSAIDDTMALISHDLSREGIRLTTEVEDLPPIVCDLGQIAQVLLNLVSNARDALRGRPGATIRLSLFQEDDQAILTVADNGPGMPTEVLDKLFQPFVTTKEKGNGLGMSICYGIIESHKGKISVMSKPDLGTTITIRLPMGTPTPLAIEAPLAPAEAVAESMVR